MGNPTVKVYLPRDDKKVIEELKNQGLSLEIKEQLELVDDIPPVVLQKIEAILKRLIDANQLASIIGPIEIKISGSDSENASMISVAKLPILILSKGLLYNAKSEDELAGVIAHELGHLLLHKEYKEDSDRNSKVEETAADNLGVEWLIKAGYDPNGLSYFLQRAGGGESHLISFEDIHKAEGLSEKVELLKTINDPHPSDVARIRTLSTHLTALKRSGDLSQIPPMSAIELGFTKAVRKISYETPIAQGLREVNYSAMSTLDKMTELGCLLSMVIPPTNRTAAERIPELATYIAKLNVDFKDPEQLEAFKSLADIIMEHREIQGVPVFPKNCIHTYDEEVEEALKTVWRRGGKDSNYLSRNEDLKRALEQFTHAQLREDAERAAQEILVLCDKISQFKRSGDFSGFNPPKLQAVNDSIAKTGQWSPPYGQHVQWYSEGQSEALKKVLYMMDVPKDPWATKRLGALSEQDALEVLRYTLQIAGRDRYFYFENYALLNQFVRDQHGVASKGPPILEPYPWQHSAANTSLHDLEAFDLDQAQKKRAFEEKVVDSIDWSLLKTDFSGFVMQYGKLLHHYSTIVPVHYPFAQRFFTELNSVLPQATTDFKAQVSDFFRSRFYDEGSIPVHPSIVERFCDLSFNKWPYLNSPRPAYWSLEHPFIQFLLQPNSSSVISDWNKLEHLRAASGFMNPDPTKRLAENLTVPLDKILMEYPKPINNIDDLVSAKKTDRYKHTAAVVIALEAERLAHELEDILSKEDFLVLNELRKDLPKEYVCNMESYFDNLRHTIAQKYLNTADGADLIANYRYLSGHDFIVDAPDIRDAAQEKIKQFLPGLAEQSRIDCLRDLFRPEVYQDLDIFALRMEKKYDAQIADPDFRHWAVDQYTDLLAARIGQDDGSHEYFESAKRVIDDISKNTAGMSQLEILSSLATKTNAQKELAYCFRDTYNQYRVHEGLSKGWGGVVIELCMNECSKDSILREKVLDFLSKPLTKESPKPLRDYIEKKYKFQLRKSSGLVIDDQLSSYHKNFRQLSLDTRSAYLEPILFPLNSNPEEQSRIINTFISDVFPTQGGIEAGQAMDNNAYAQLILGAYFNAADLSERRILATALFITNMKDKEHVERTSGQKLSLLLSNIGPAGGKLLQAIHSHPQTPEDIKKDLAASKTLFDPPLRWELVEYVDKSNLLTASEHNPNPVTYIGKLVGAGSFGITVFNKLADDSEVADIFLRKNAAKRATRELAMMKKAAKEIVKISPDLDPILGMVDEAKRSADDETEMSLAYTANQKAEEAYNNIEVKVGDEFFVHKATQLQKTGEHFKRVSIAHGEHFNDLPDSPHKISIAKSMIALQLSLRLAGFNTDLDRHGGNIKVLGNTITHFDFGAMNTLPITSEDKAITGMILARTVLAVSKGENFTQSALNNIQKAEVSSASRIYLSGLTKDFLALGDYIKIVKPTELASIVAKCLIASTVDKEINAAFYKELGAMQGFLVKRILESSAKEADTAVQGLGFMIERRGYPGVFFPSEAEEKSSAKGEQQQSGAKKKGAF